MDRDGKSGQAPLGALPRQDSERFGVAPVVAKQENASRPLPFEEPLQGCPLPASGRRPKFDDLATLEAFESLSARGVADRRNRGVQAPHGLRRVGRLTKVEGHGWAFRLDEQPVWATEPLGDRAPQPLRGLDERLERRVDVDDEVLGPRPPRQAPALQAVIAEVFQPTDANAPGNVQGSPA